MSFKNKTAIVTGAASGMGLLCCKELYKKGANVVLVDINEEELNKLAKSMPKSLCIKADITKYEEVKRTVQLAIEKFKTVDILINMAGGNACRILNRWASFPERDIKDIEWGIALNLMAPIYYCHEVMGIMQKQNSGVIINIGSIAGVEADKHCPDYGISKSGIITGLTQSMAAIGAPYNVRCCCVSPGPVLTRKSMADMQTMLNRAGKPKEVVDLIMFLASDKASFITGCNYMVDGGRSAMAR